MKRVYLYNHIKTGNKILISDEPAHYIKHVLRMNPGSTFCAFDGSGNEYILKIKKISLNAIESEIVEEKYTEEKEPEISIELCLCLCKNKTFENILKKAAEIGVSTIIPIKSARSISDVDDKKSFVKIERWKKIAAEGSKIAGRTRIPEIIKVENFETVISRNVPGILFWEQSRMPIKDILNNLSSKIKEERSITIFIGPEGGFTDEEVKKTIRNQIFVASLGPRILSVETASILALGIVSYELGFFSNK